MKNSYSKGSWLMIMLLYGTVVFADSLTTESQSSIESALAIKKEKRLLYNEAESNDFYIDQCARDVNGVRSNDLL